MIKKTTIVDKINVTLHQSLLSSHSMLINKWLRQREAEFSSKAPTTTNLQYWIGGKGGNGNIKSRFFGVTLDFVQDCLKIHEYCICYIFKDWDQLFSLNRVKSYFSLVWVFFFVKTWVIERARISGWVIEANV